MTGPCSFRVIPDAPHERIRLSKHEMAVVLRTATELSTYHGRLKSEEQLATTFNGLKGECATVKFLNYGMGANPRIPFNTTYIDGGDGGKDIEICKALFDAKHSISGIFHKRYVLKTAADFIIFCSSKFGSPWVDILGFAPTEYIKRAPATLRAIHLRQLTKFWPDRFVGKIRIPKHQPGEHDLTSTAELIPEILRTIERLQAVYVKMMKENRV